MQYFADPTIRTVLFLLTGAIVGGLVGWLIARYRADRRHAAILAEKKIRLATLGQALHARTRALSKIKTDLEFTKQELREANRVLFSTAQDKAAAQSRLERLDALEETITRREDEIDAANDTIARLKADRATLEIVLKKERRHAEEKISLLEDLRAGLTDTYKALAAGVMRENSRAFLDLAGETFSGYMASARKDLDNQRTVMGEVVKPVENALKRYDQQVRAMERSREAAYGSLIQQVAALLKSQNDLQKETGRLARAMRVPHVRGRWGELTLRRTVELAGMTEYCDFTEQTTVQTAGGQFRPDMIVRLPEGRRIIIDAKVPLSAYLDALDAETDEKAEACLATHAKQVQNHILQLAQKSYWAQFDQSPEFVVLFIPGENFFSAALTKNPDLIEIGARHRVIPATPTTLISLLRTIAMGWHHAKASENTHIISELGKELYERLQLMLEHVNHLGKNLERCVGDYNKFVGSLTRRVIVSARKFEDMGIPAKDDHSLPDAGPVDTTPRPPDMKTERKICDQE
ncbi:MAG: DNA recombination protein RmuC [Deltaproteobacteria bacterium]|nr:MAG: DNA recombination protein RmuC [Deltaproteobacteria bacterium]